MLALSELAFRSLSSLSASFSTAISGCGLAVLELGTLTKSAGFSNWDLPNAAFQ